MKKPKKSVQERIVNNLIELHGFDLETAIKVEKTGINPLFVKL